ncbi:LysR family transcriptional regulator [Izhakiella australiensis]|uniref:LysR family transcriptional regulator n=1 Tax=Izhakiella australiensis TaxID=1926881 RepID=A0A1S8YN86_9GAMM|nr:LysR family transcriptional regulator [Izhakiella australiensis]OON40328.1 LysR family transcriptional regulator [Izhakiella australiensis]
MNEPDFNLLIALDMLLTEVSVVAAARRLNLSASAMSRTLSRLRSATADPLLVRAGRHMVLTPYAQRIRERTRQAVIDARAVLRPCAEEFDVTTLARTFIIRSNEGFVEAYGAALIAAARVAPQVLLCFAPKPEKSASGLREGWVDLEIGVLGDTGPEIRLQALFRDRFVGVVRAGHPLAQRDPVTLEDYLAFSHVVASRRGKVRGPVDEALSNMGLSRNVAAVVPGFPAALAVARSSDLVALVPASLVSSRSGQQSHGCPDVFAFELPLNVEGITVSLIWHPRLEADPGHRWLRQLVRDCCHSAGA